jgi:hypothetical protein
MLLDQFGLGFVAGHDPEATEPSPAGFRVQGCVCQGQLGDAFGFCLVDMQGAVPAAVGDEGEADAEVCWWSAGGGREDQQRLVGVEAVVAEGDERVVLAAVVPAQAQAWQVRGAGAQIQHGFIVWGVFVAVFVVEVVSSGAALEEAARGELAGVADDDDLVGAVQAADGVGRGDLGGFVEDDGVEFKVWRDEFADRQWAHHEAGLEAGGKRASAAQQLSDGPVAALTPRLVLDL